MQNWSMLAKRLVLLIIASFLIVIGSSAFVLPPNTQPAPAPTATPKKTHKWSPTSTPTATATATPIPGALCVTVFEDTNSNGLWDTTPPAPPPAPTPTVAFTPEPLLAPQNVTVKNLSGATVDNWDGTGAQPHCFGNMWPGSYTAIEANAAGYGSTTADSVTAPVLSGQSTSVLFGDLRCTPLAPHMYDVTTDPSGNYWLHWDSVGANSYQVYGSFTSQTAGSPPEAWHLVATITTVNYQVVPATDGTFFYVLAKNNCGSSDPSNVVALP